MVLSYHRILKTTICTIFQVYIINFCKGSYIRGKSERHAIVGGMEAERDRHPYAVAILKNNSTVPFCGGSLISNQWVLTAAHCFAGQVERVQIGRYNFSETNSIYEDIDVEIALTHPQYDDYTLDYDFMLLKLKEPSNYPPIKLHDSRGSDLMPNSILTTMGWGTTSFLGPQSDVLKEANVDFMSKRQCLRRYFLFGGVTDSMLCAIRPRTDACQGDSGGPLVKKGKDASTDVQVGVVSWGIGCGTRLLPGVYADVGIGKDWILYHATDAKFVKLEQ